MNPVSIKLGNVTTSANLRCKHPGHRAERKREENARHEDDGDSCSLSGDVRVGQAVDFRREAGDDRCED